MFQVDTARNGYKDPEGARLVLQLLEAVRDTPGVASAAIAGHTLLAGGSWNTHMTVDFKERTGDGSPGPLQPGLAGILLDARREADRRARLRGAWLDRLRQPNRRYRSAIVNASFARRYFGDASPIGHRIGFGTRPDTKTDIEIVGVVADFSYRGIREETEQAFFPFLDIPWSGGDVLRQDAREAGECVRGDSRHRRRASIRRCRSSRCGRSRTKSIDR